MVYQVGSPAMLEGNRFLPETGTPIWKMVRSSTVLELCEPAPFTVATWMLISLTMGLLAGRPACWIATSVVATGSYPCALCWTGVGFALMGKLFIIQTALDGGKAEPGGRTGLVTAPDAILRGRTAPSGGTYCIV